MKTDSNQISNTTCQSLKTPLFVPLLSLLLAFVIGITGCTSVSSLYKQRIPKSGSDYNGAVQYTEPRIETSHTTFTTISKYVFALGSGAGAGYLGYTATRDANVKNGTDDSPSGSAAIYGLVGYGLGYYIFKWIAPSEGNVPLTIGNERTWINHLNDQIKNNAVFASSPYPKRDSLNLITVLPDTAIKGFTLKSYNDAFILRNAFANNPRTEGIFKAALPNIERDRLEPIIELYSSSPVATLLQEAFVQKSNSFEQCMAAYKRYPSTQIVSEQRASELAKYLIEYSTYLGAFPNGANRERMLAAKAVAQKQFDEEQVRARQRRAESDRQQAELDAKRAEEARIAAEKQRIQDEKDREQLRQENEKIKKSYSQSERARLESDVIAQKEKVEVKKAELEMLKEQLNNTNQSLRNLTGYRNPLRPTLEEQYNKEQGQVNQATLQLFSLQMTLNDLYKKAPWMKP